jgi:Fe-S oxidoreductase
MLSFDPELWNGSRSAIEIMNAAGVDVGIMGKEENCCGGRAYETGYVGEFTKYAQHSIETFNSIGVSAVVTSCSDGFSFFKKLYPKLGMDMKFEVLHTVELLDRLTERGKLSFRQEVPMKVTYHDPCHLGRHLPAGVYEPPRNVLKRIPGIELVEMQRNRENAWCCGAGAGASQANPEFALWTANERLKEAQLTGASAIVTACPWCERNFRDAAKEYGVDMPVFDVAEIVRRAC